MKQPIGVLGQMTHGYYAVVHDENKPMHQGWYWARWQSLQAREAGENPEKKVPVTQIIEVKASNNADELAMILAKNGGQKVIMLQAVDRSRAVYDFSKIQNVNSKFVTSKIVNWVCFNEFLRKFLQRACLPWSMNIFSFVNLTGGSKVFVSSSVSFSRWPRRKTAAVKLRIWSTNPVWTALLLLLPMTSKISNVLRSRPPSRPRSAPPSFPNVRLASRVLHFLTRILAFESLRVALNLVSARLFRTRHLRRGDFRVEGVWRLLVRSTALAVAFITNRFRSIRFN